MTQQARLLHHSIRELGPHRETFARRFYGVLFQKHPEIELLFRGVSMSEQENKLWSALTVIVGSLSQPTQLTEFLHALGRRHATYGVRPEHDSAATDALLTVLPEFMGEGWTQELHAAWLGALKHVSTAMSEAASEP